MIDTTIIQQHIQPNSTLVVGFSGGPDSVFLLTLLHELVPKLHLKIIAAHLDHEWRKESGKDSAWCKKFCDDRSIAVEMERASNLDFDIKHNGSQAEIGRKLRRFFFEQLATKHQADRIVLAHHGDDQLETFFIRLARGASIAGLCGIKENDGLYLRPLLCLSKQEILDYLHHHNIDFLTDPTNTDPKYLRNRIRKSLIPTLQQIDSRFLKNISHAMHHLEKTDDFLKQSMHDLLPTIKNSTGIHIPSFLKLHEVMQHHIFMHLFIENKVFLTPSSALFQEILRFLKNNKTQSHQLHPELIIIKQGDYFYFKSL